MNNYSSDMFAEQGSSNGQSYDDSQAYNTPSMRMEDMTQHVDLNQREHLGGRQHKPGRSKNQHRRTAKEKIEEFEKAFNGKHSQR